MERALLKHDQQSLDHDLEQACRSVASLMSEARALTRETLVLAGYDPVHCRQLSRRPGRPRKAGITLRERHETLFRSVDIQEACRLAALAIDRLARLNHEADDPSRQRLCRALMEDATEIAGDDSLPAEQVLAIAIVLSRELAEITGHFRAVMGTGPRSGPNPATAETLLDRLRRRLERVV